MTRETQWEEKATQINTDLMPCLDGSLEDRDTQGNQSQVNMAYF